MLTVHHLNESRSTRVLWLLNELDIPYEVVKHQRDPETHLAPQSLKQVHPLGKAPVMVDDDLTLCESGAIMEYLLDKAEGSCLRPNTGTPEYYQYQEWLHFAEGSLALPVIASLMMKMEQRTGDKPMDGYIAKEVNVDFAYIDATLAKQSYFAGSDFTAADIMMTVMLEIADKVGLLAKWGNIKAYLEKVQARGAYQAARSYG
ncbi:glutathione S-transferase family protein [Pseudoalteromonas piscicida]|uniref:glutathione transferase n=1 Tax=Pseudoalteromonas piscicida TaxID=43662 RepID=A0A2A5JQG4_PSEO7|nr:glutathione S-transferase family protein [Pseudoalteromonas piscicida]PCK31666.1 glutathione S-transferase [Pseudoalteromonas piscicida]